jgi:SPP1 gp7 family putative phage head morphogenesis protein
VTAELTLVRGKPRARRATTLPPSRPNAGLAAVYRRRLETVLDEMHQSLLHWISAEWRQQSLPVAMDAPVSSLQIEMGRLADRWLKRFDQLAPKLARWFATDSERRVTRHLEDALREGGISVRFVQTSAMRTALEATVGQNVALIRNIPQQHLAAVEGAVMRSAASGRDLATLTKDLREVHGVTRRRAAFVARDQNNKASAVMARARQLELGVTTAIWRHSRGGREPRPAHVAMDGKTYDVKLGMWDPEERKFVLPGELVNCRCSSQPIIPGFGD